MGCALTPTAPPSRSLLRALFAIDPRSLAAFRIALGAILLVDLCIRAADLSAMYTDEGMLSRTTICRHYGIWNWSFHFGSGSGSYQAALFAFAGVLALLLLVGFETRLVAVSSWLMLISLHNRVPPVLSGADNLARLLLFWGIFLPLGRVWSVDAWLAKRRDIGRSAPEPVLSVASAAILLQMAFVYLFSAVFKSNADWLASGEAEYGRSQWPIMGLWHIMIIMTTSRQDRRRQREGRTAALNVAEAKKQFSDLLGRVAYGGETILILRRGKPMARLVPPEDVRRPHLADAKGWLDDDDPLFSIIDDTTRKRGARTPRVLKHRRSKPDSNG